MCLFWHHRIFPTHYYIHNLIHNLMYFVSVDQHPSAHKIYLGELIPSLAIIYDHHGLILRKCYFSRCYSPMWITACVLKGQLMNVMVIKCPATAQWSTNHTPLYSIVISNLYSLQTTYMLRRNVHVNKWFLWRSSGSQPLVLCVCFRLIFCILKDSIKIV